MRSHSARLYGRLKMFGVVVKDCAYPNSWRPARKATLLALDNASLVELWLAGKRMTELPAWHKFHHKVSPLLPKRVHRPLKGTEKYKDMI